MLPGFVSVRGVGGEETHSNWNLLLHIYLRKRGGGGGEQGGYNPPPLWTVGGGGGGAQPPYILCPKIILRSVNCFKKRDHGDKDKANRCVRLNGCSERLFTSQ